MLPIGVAIVNHLNQAGAFHRRETLQRNFSAALMFGIAYAASIGGIGTLIGTPPNIIMAGMAETLIGKSISFTAWLGVGVPLVIVLLPLAWLYLVRWACPIWGRSQFSGGEVIRQELAKLGRLSSPERRVALVFILTALAWLCSEEKNFGAFLLPGLKNLFPGIGDGSIAIAGAIALFLLPAKGLFGEKLLDWTAAKDIPWGVLLLFGGGLALAEGFQQTGLDNWIGQQLSLFQHTPHLLIVLIVTILVIFLTEVTSNTATTAMILPVCVSLASGIGMDALMLIVPATIAASCTFMLPVGTPPNALIFASGYVTIPQMARIGVGMNLLGIILITVFSYFVAVPILGIP
ncbi:MAG: DASS family sodium-coupled anion symporter [bacterium]